VEDLTERSDQKPISPTLAAVRASMKRSGRTLSRHHRRMLRKHWPKPAAEAKASVNVRVRADMRHDANGVGIQTQANVVAMAI
jgi:hypothetical protein